MRAIIFANGIINNWPSGFVISQNHDLLIAADGGVRHCIDRDLRPDIIVGDMDSISPPELAKFEAMGVKIVRFPMQKDETDLHLAIKEAINRGIKEIVILGALGARWDMSLSNLLLSASSSLRDVDIRFLESGLEILCLHHGQEINLQGKPGNVVSLLPLSEAAEGIHLKGFEYPLENESLYLGTTRGISNVLKEKTGHIKLEKGYLIIIKESVR